MELTRKQKRWVKRIALFLFFAIFVVSFRTALLQGMGNLLIHEDDFERTQVLVVLGGNSLERGTAALELYKSGRVEHIVCSGGNIPGPLEAIGQPMYEAELTALFLTENGVPADAITVLTNSTSTLEESQEVLQWVGSLEGHNSAENGLFSVTVLSSRFHTGRVRRVFQKTWKGAKFDLRVTGAPSLNYDENEWWKSEEGLIMVNNEYVKSLYYLIKH